MTKKILVYFSFLIVLISIVFISTFVDAAKRFDVTDISYSYVSYNHPYYPNVPYYNNYTSYDYYYPSGYVSPYTGNINYTSPYYSTYVSSYPVTYSRYSYYPTYSGAYYPTYSNTVSYVTPQTQVSFSWQ